MKTRAGTTIKCLLLLCPTLVLLTALLTGCFAPGGSELSLRNLDHPRTEAVLTREWRNTQVLERATEALRQELTREVLSTSGKTAAARPIALGHYQYSTRPERGAPLPVLVQIRRGGDNSLTTERTIDLNRIRGSQFDVRLSGIKISPDHHRVAVGLEIPGHQVQQVFIAGFDKSGPFQVEDCLAHDFEWMNELQLLAACQESREDLVLTRFDLRGRRLPSQVLKIPEWPRYQTTLRRSLDGEFVFLRTATAHSAKERMFAAAADSLHPDFSTEFSGPKSRLYSVNGSLLWLTDVDSSEYHLLKLRPSDKPETLFRAEEGAVLEEVQVFRAFIAVRERFQGQSRIRLLRHDGAVLHKVDPESPLEGAYFTLSRDFDTSDFEYELRSFTKSPRRIKLRVESRTQLPPPVPEVDEGSSLRADRIWVASSDGVRIPVSIVAPKGLRLDRPAPTLLVSYGAYGETIEPHYPSRFAPLLRRGWRIAYAHIRGGGYLGRTWHLSATGDRKSLSAADLTAVISALVARRLANPASVCLFSRSAGALTTARALVDLNLPIGAVVLEAPFLDPISAFESGSRLSEQEQEEWGDLSDPVVRGRVRALSPLQNLPKANYPPLLLTASTRDSVVPYWQALEWGRKQRAMNLADSPTYIRINHEGSHDGRGFALDRAGDDALILAFLLHEVNSKH